MRVAVKKIILLFIGSFLATAVFSASLKVFFQEVSWREVLIARDKDLALKLL